MEESAQFSTGEGKPRKRAQRVQLACLPCRQGKLKCNREYPVCDQCYKRSRESSCVYSQKGLRYNAARQKMESMKDTVDRLESFVNRIKDSKAEASLRNPSADDRGRDAGLVKDGVPLIGNLQLSEKGSTQYWGPGHWESIIEDIADVKAYFQSESSPGASGTDETDSPSNILPIDITFGVTLGHTKEDIINLLPPKAEIDRYVATWFNAPDRLTVILHGPTFQAEYQNFWSNPTGASAGWLALLLAVSGVGAEVSSQTFNDPVIATRAEDLRRLTAHALVVAEYISPQPYVLEAMMMQVKGLLFKQHDTTKAIWHLHGQVMRLCWLAGYHRDPGNNPAIPAFDCEMRRRVWMLACEYDMLTCQQIGMTSLVNNAMVDTATPGNRLDSDFSKSHMLPPRPSDEYTPMLSAVQYSKIVRIMGEVAMTIGAATFPSRAEVERQYAKVMTAHDELPAIHRFASMDQSFTDPPGLILDRFRLETMHKKIFCVLYRPFLGKAESETEHERCLQASEELVRLNIAMVEACQRGGQFAGLRVYVRRHVHDFNLAAMLLCSELKRQSTSGKKQEWADRVRPLLLQGCGLWGMSGVTSPKARHAITAIEKFLLQDSQEAQLSTTTTWPWTNGLSGDVSETTVANNDLSLGAGDMTFASDIGSTLSEQIDLGQEPFNIVQDPLFQDLFGPNYSMGERDESIWTV